ncbi:hypothetical protein [Thermus caliditerrae]|uniref:Uncharacterized protein n=1 Tax=Thermus caliditerrae TaxID=1330700 RepID=A0A7C5VH20_9DEIN|nr:hypothetical protein [Thermus caliditerrae]
MRTRESPAHRRLSGLLALRLSLLLEKLRRPTLFPKPPPALVREQAEVRVPLRLDLPYYPAKQGTAHVLIPWDPYMQEVEEALRSL